MHRLEGSCIVRIKNEDYENNAVQNLSNGDMFKKMDEDPSEETEEKVISFVDKLVEKEHIAETTAGFIKAKTINTKPGAYTEQPKTHKFENVPEMRAGFPARGIVSCKNTPTEALQDYVDFLVNPSMREARFLYKGYQACSPESSSDE